MHGEAYHHLARAAVCEILLMEEPNFDELYALICQSFTSYLPGLNEQIVLYGLVPIGIFG